MANPPWTSAQPTADGGLVVIAGRTKFTFPPSTNPASVVGLPFADVQAMQGVVQAAVKTAVDAAVAQIIAALKPAPGSFDLPADGGLLWFGPPGSTPPKVATTPTTITISRT